MPSSVWKGSIVLSYAERRFQAQQTAESRNDTDGSFGGYALQLVLPWKDPRHTRSVGLLLVSPKHSARSGTMSFLLTFHVSEFSN